MTTQSHDVIISMIVFSARELVDHLKVADELVSDTS